MSRRYVPRRPPASHPLAGTCPMCDKPLDEARLVKPRGVWVHRTCWQGAHE